MPDPVPPEPDRCGAAACDEALVARCRDELPYDTRAFEALVRRYQASVHQACYGFLRQDGDAEDVTQEVFLSVFTNLAEFRGDCAFRHWLFRIARNKCISRLRSRDRRDRLQAEYVAQVAADSAEVAVASPAREDGAGPMTEALHRLSPRDQAALHLRYLEQLPFRQVARALAVSISAAKMRVRRAEQRLVDLYHLAMGTTPEM